MQEEEETCTSIDASIEHHPSSSIVGEVITLEEGTLVAVQDVPNIYQGMHIFHFLLLLSHHMEDYGNMLSWKMHDLGSKHIADVEQ